MGFQHMTREAIQALGMKTGGLNRKLSFDQVKALRECTGRVADVDFAVDFDVSECTIFHARVGNTYKDHPSKPRRHYTRKVAA